MCTAAPRPHGVRLVSLESYFIGTALGCKQIVYACGQPFDRCVVVPLVRCTDSMPYFPKEVLTWGQIVFGEPHM